MPTSARPRTIGTHRPKHAIGPRLAAPAALLLALSFLGGCGASAGGGAAPAGVAGPDILSLPGAPSAPPARPSLRETSFSGATPDDPAARKAYDYVAKFNELMALPGSGELQDDHSWNCKSCVALSAMVLAQANAGTHYEKPIWRITSIEAKPGLFGAREMKVTLDPITTPVLTTSGERVVLGPEWKRIVTLQVSAVDSESKDTAHGEWEISGTAIAKG